MANYRHDKLELSEAVRQFFSFLVAGKVVETHLLAALPVYLEARHDIERVTDGAFLCSTVQGGVADFKLATSIAYTAFRGERDKVVRGRFFCQKKLAMTALPPISPDTLDQVMIEIETIDSLIKQYGFRPFVAFTLVKTLYPLEIEMETKVEISSEMAEIMGLDQSRKLNSVSAGAFEELDVAYLAAASALH